VTNSWIKLQDFTETTLWVNLTNTTTGVEIGITSDIEIVELFEAGMTMRLPPNCCATGHLLAIKMWQNPNGQNHGDKEPDPKDLIELTAKVMGTDTSKSGAKFYEFNFYQFPQDKWRAFIKNLEKKQRSVDKIVKNIQE